MNDKQLLAFVISNIDLMANRLRIIKKEYSTKSNMESTNDKLIFIYERERVKVYHPDSRFSKENYFTFYVYNKNIIQSMIDSGIQLNNKGGNLQEYICHISFLENVLRKYCVEIFDAKFPPHSVPASLLPYFIQMLEKCIRFISLGRRKDNGVRYFCGFEVYCINEKEGLKKYGAFSHKYIYTSVQWDYESVELYKEKINWKGLIELSNLKWSETNIRRFYSHIPFKLDGQTYTEIFNPNYTITDFSNICKLSNDFIKEKITDVNIEALLKTAEFHWNSRNFIDFYQEFYHLNQKYNITHGAKAETEFHRYLINNNRFQWTPQLIAAYLEIDNNLWQFFKGSKQFRKSLVPIFKDFFQHYPKSANSINIDIDLFLSLLIEGKADIRSHSTCAYYFTIENILKNKEEWDTIIYDCYDHIHHLSRDTWYFVFAVRTMWNYFNSNENVMLNYELCKLLENMNIIIGGEYEKEYRDQQYIDEGFISKEVNALDYFAKHSIEENEVVKILTDVSLTHKLLKAGNISIIDGLISRLFSDYTPEEFFTLLDNLNISL